MHSGDGTGCFHFAHVHGLPAELIQNHTNGLFCCLVISADEHGRLALPEHRVHDAVIADGIEGLDEPRASKFVCNAP